MNNTISSIPASELLSALADGELGNSEVSAALIACHRDRSAALSSWNTYQLIGNVLRAPSSTAQGADAQFLANFRQRLAQERAADLMDVVTAPAEAKPQSLAEGWEVLEARRTRGRASNDESFRWKLAAGFASLAAVSAIAWNVSGFSALPAGSQLAQGPVPQQVLVASPQGPVVRDARLEELLAAHRQFGGMSALQAPSGFLQSATFETPQGTRR